MCDSLRRDADAKGPLGELQVSFHSLGLTLEARTPGVRGMGRHFAPLLGLHLAGPQHRRRMALLHGRASGLPASPMVGRARATSGLRKALPIPDGPLDVPPIADRQRSAMTAAGMNRRRLDDRRRSRRIGSRSTPYTLRYLSP